MRKTTSTLMLLCLLTGASAVSASMSPEVQKAIEAAVAAVDRANSVGYEWRDTRDMIEKAREAAKAGNDAKALELAREAEVQGELGYRQYLDQRGAGPHF